MTEDAVLADDFGEDGMQCTKHPYKNTVTGSTAGGICAFCLQEKLGKLVSASSVFNVVGSSSPSFRSDPSAAANAASISLRPAASSSTNNASRHPLENHANRGSSTRRARIPFLLTHKKKNKVTGGGDHHSHSTSNGILRRSKSAVVPRQDYTHAHKRPGFWSFLYHSKPKPQPEEPQPPPPPSIPDPVAHPLPSTKPIAPAINSSKRTEYVIVVDGDDSPNSASTNATTSFGRRVSRSRSVGCGSRRFSGDFFERISTGFGDCTLRRVESQREGKRRSSGDVIHEKVRCAGIFSGFIMTSAEDEHHSNGKVHGRSKSWGWALASPMRALGKPSPSSSTKDLKTEAKSNATPNLSAIPSLLTARG